MKLYSIYYLVDPKAEIMGNMSPYCAMNNNPVNYSDLEEDLPFLAVLAIGAATGILSNGLVNISSDRSFLVGLVRLQFGVVLELRQVQE
ncbi:MAG: hypothetical protein IPH94_09265 [Saprospiraceae bacterium]|nr:hypothetical protein [Saprospiraceae bacterium]